MPIFCLTVWKRRDCGLDPPEEEEETETPKSNIGHIFTPKEMKDMWSDIAAMVKPSWVAKPPTNESGKRKAAEWRLLGTTYLPASLVRLWSQHEEGNEESELRRKLLLITMSLVSAIIIVSSRETSDAHAREYLRYMTDYMKGVRELFPEYKFLPNHHMAMHIHEFLLRYGPVHGWWTFPYERLIGKLERIPSNYRPGEFMFQCRCRIVLDMR